MIQDTARPHILPGQRQKNSQHQHRKSNLHRNQRTIASRIFVRHPLTKNSWMDGSKRRAFESIAAGELKMILKKRLLKKRLHVHVSRVNLIYDNDELVPDNLLLATGQQYPHLYYKMGPRVYAEEPAKEGEEQKKTEQKGEQNTAERRPERKPKNQREEHNKEEERLEMFDDILDDAEATEKNVKKLQRTIETEMSMKSKAQGSQEYVEGGGKSSNKDLLIKAALDKGQQALMGAVLTTRFQSLLVTNKRLAPALV
eukprot:3912421-Amphidinium_carterae.1